MTNCYLNSASPAFLARSLRTAAKLEVAAVEFVAETIGEVKEWWREVGSWELEDSGAPEIDRYIIIVGG